jgi:hypothetical protein
VLHMFRQLLFWAENQCNHQNVPSLQREMAKKQKKILFEEK